MLSLSHNLQSSPIVWGGVNKMLSPSHVDQAYPGEELGGIRNNAPYNHIFFTKEVRDRDRSVIDQLDALDRQIQDSGSSDPIWLHIYSYGGDLFTGFQIANHIQMTQTPVYTVIEGIAASAATIISSAGDKRFALSNSQFMIHQLSSIMWGTASEFEDEYRLQQDLMDQLTAYYSGRVNKSAANPQSSEQIRAMLNRNTFISSKRALEMGFIDGVIVDGQIVTDPSKLSIYTTDIPEQIENKVKAEVNTTRIAEKSASIWDLITVPEGTTTNSLSSSTSEVIVAEKRIAEEAVQETPPEEIVEDQEEVTEVEESQEASEVRENKLIKQVENIAAGIKKTAKKQNSESQQEDSDAFSSILAALTRLEAKIDDVSSRVNSISDRTESVENDITDVKDAFPVLAESVMQYIVDAIGVGQEETNMSKTERAVVQEMSRKTAQHSIKPSAQGLTPRQQMLQVGIPVGAN